MNPHLLRGALATTGAAGLVLEITWLRLFGHALGATYAVAGLVLGAYLGGLGLGALFWTRRSIPKARGLGTLARLECGAALSALPIPLLLQGLASTLPWELATWLPVQAAIIAPLVALPAFFAGGSLPAAVAIVPGPTEATRLYAANTAGAVAGALGAALLPAIVGVLPLYAGACVLQLIVAAIAWGHARRAHGAPDSKAISERDDPERIVEEAAPARVESAAPLVAAAASGFVLLGMELVWMRLLSTKLHNSALTYGLVLAIVLASLFAGARLAPVIARWETRGLFAVWAAGFVALAVSPWIFAQMAGGTSGLGRGDIPGYLLRGGGIVAAVAAPPCVLIGASLPLLWQRSRGMLEQRVGRLLGVNTLASVVGSAAVGAGLLPSFGVAGTFRFLLVTASLGLGAAARVSGLGRRAALSILAVVALGASLVPLPPPERLGSPLPLGASLVATKRGAHGELSVIRDRRGNQHLRHNAIYGLGSDGNPSFHRRMGHLALLRHGAPERVAFLGMGTGITASAALDHPSVSEISVLELMPEVVDLNEHFAEANGHLLSDPRVQVVIGDGRRALARPSRPLDLVVSDLFIPWHPGTSDLYALELFETIRGRLQNDGLFALWIPAYQLGGAELASVIAAFRRVFPVSEGVLGQEGSRRPVLGLFGHRRAELPPLPSTEQVEKLRRHTRFPWDRGLEPRSFEQLWLGPLPALDAEPNRQGQPIVELLAPLSHLRSELLIGDAFRDFLEAHFPSMRRGWVLRDAPTSDD
jgi:spermidine synthase